MKPVQVPNRSLFPVSPIVIENCLTLWREVSLYFEPLTQSHIELMIGSDLQLDSFADSLSNSTNETVVDRLLSCLVPLSNPAETGMDGMEGEWEKDGMWRVEEEKNRAQSKEVEPFLMEELAKLGLVLQEEEEEEEEVDEEEEKEVNEQIHQEPNNQIEQELNKQIEQEPNNQIEQEPNNQIEQEEKEKRNEECAKLWKEIVKLKEERRELFGGIKEKCFEEMRVEKRRRELEWKDRQVIKRWEESIKRVHYNGSTV